MAIRLEDYLATLPEERRQAIEKRTAELIAEEKARWQGRQPETRPPE